MSFKNMMKPAARQPQVRDTDRDFFPADDMVAMERLPSTTSTEKNGQLYSINETEASRSDSIKEAYETNDGGNHTDMEQANDGLLYRDGKLVKQPAPTQVCMGGGVYSASRLPIHNGLGECRD